MILGDWVRQREPVPPAELSARIEQTLGRRFQGDAADASELCIAAAEELLRELLARPTAGRESALDLLTVDALVTYAFEAASENPDTLTARAEAAMSRLASTVQ